MDLERKIKEAQVKSRINGSRMGLLSVKQQKYLQGLAEGKTSKQAALDAGYSKGPAKNGVAGVLGFNPEKHEAFRTILQSVFSPEEFANRLLAGCDSTEVRLLPAGSTKRKKELPNGEILEVEQYADPKEVHLVAWNTRLRYLELWARISGYVTEKGDDAGKTQLAQIQKIYEAGPAPAHTDDD